MKKISIVLVLFIYSLSSVYSQTGTKPVDTDSTKEIQASEAPTAKVAPVKNIVVENPTEPNDSMALLQVSTKNKKETPIVGQKVSFVNKANGATFSGVSDATGRFNILIPKGMTYDFRINIVGTDTTMRTFTVPNEPELITINYTFIDIPPRVIKLDRVYFDSNKAILRSESFKMLNNLVEYLNIKPYIEIEIAGHTDNTGDYQSNMTLSQKRAEAVRDYLVRANIKPSRLKPVGYGPNKPIDTNETERGKQNNRRTEVYITKSE